LKRLADGGITFKLGLEIGRDISFADLRAQHDAVFIAAGAYRAREIEIPGVTLNRIVAALDYLIASNRRGFGDADVPKSLDAKNKTVAVVGGGDTAMDCVRTAMRQGAKSVSCVYRRDRDNMPGSLREVANAEEEGIVFEWLTLPKGFLGRKNVEGVRLTRSRLGMPDASGRKAPQEIPGSDFTLEADLVIKALGFDVEDLPAKFDAPGLGVTRWGTLAAKETATTMDGVFAGGDVTRGASLVVWAIRDGRDAAAAIHKHLSEKAALVGEAAE
jgi:glutamate synthase (NADPH/NADH) small chain